MSMKDLPKAYQKLLKHHLEESETLEAVHVKENATTDLLALTDRRVIAGGRSTGNGGRSIEEVTSIALSKVESAKIEQRGVEPINITKLYTGIAAIIIGLVAFGAFPALTGTIPLMFTPLALSLLGLLVALGGLVYVGVVTNTEDEYTKLTFIMENGDTIPFQVPADAYDVACQITGAIGNRWN